MTVDEIAIQPDEALKAFHAYRDAVRADRSGARSVWAAEDRVLATAYKAASRGKRLLDLTTAFTRGGLKVFADAAIPLPALAICPSDAATCHLDISHNGEYLFRDRQSSWRVPPSRQVTIQAGVLPPVKDWSSVQTRYSTLVPLVPPQFRPKSNLANYHTLWEVEKWTPEPPIDPILLKHLTGELYIVLASWNLSPLERAVLRQTRRAEERNSR